MNFHISSKFETYLKNQQMESKYQQLNKLEKNKEVTLVNDIEAALVAESHINRCETW